MIRDRRDEDLARLGEILRALDGDPSGDLAGVLAGRQPRDWLLEVDAECSWVFDQAPVSVAPTRNVIAHLQIYRPRDEARVAGVVAQLGRGADELLVVGRLFVKPGRHAAGVRRYLATEAVKHVERSGKVPVLEPAAAERLPASLRARFALEARD